MGKRPSVESRQIAQDRLKRIGRAVDALEAELVAFLRRLVQIPTENPPGRNYRECAGLIGLKLQELGCRVRYEEVSEELLPSLAPHGHGLPRMSVIGSSFRSSTTRRTSVLP